MKWSMLLSAFIFLAGQVGMAFARSDVSESPALPKQNPLDAKELAKDKFRALNANLDVLKHARLKAARVQRDARYKEFLAGRGTLCFLLEAAQCALKSQLAVCANQAETIAALENYWSLMRSLEEVNRARMEAGRIPYKEYRQSTYYRIDAEERLRAARGRK